nr:ras GTPase-activating protein 2-like [Marmota flaviventris]
MIEKFQIVHNASYVLPSEYYGPLKTLLLKSPDVQPISASAAYILGEIRRDKNDAVLPLVRLLLNHDKLVPFVTAVVELNLKDTQDANTIFRENSLATRCLDEMMKIVGGHYLKVTLKSTLDEICESSKSCEIDPIKLKEGDNVENNKENLRYYVDKLFSTIVRSSMSCPTVMCDIFYSLRQMATQRFPNDPHVQYSAVSSFVFLRFFAVAVVSPHTFHLRPHHPDAQTIRTLTLISKTIQTLGSRGSLSKSNSSFKETFMCEFFKMFQEKGYIIAVKKFLDEISTETKESSGTSEPVHLKEGEMNKRAQGRTRIGKKNFKKWWFCLTSRELTYHKQPGKNAMRHSYSLPIFRKTLAMKKVQEE